MAEDIAQILLDFPAIDPHTAIIAVDPGFYCIIPDETRAEAAREIARLRRVLRGIAEYCSGDSNKLGAIKRLIAIRNTAEQALPHEQSSPIQGKVATGEEAGEIIRGPDSSNAIPGARIKPTIVEK